MKKAHFYLAAFVFHFIWFVYAERAIQLEPVVAFCMIILYGLEDTANSR